MFPKFVSELVARFYELRKRALVAAGRPFAPVSRAHVQPLAAVRIHPARGDTPAGKNQGMRPIPVEDGQFDIAVDRRGRYGVPHQARVSALRRRRIEIYQNAPHTFTG